MDEERRVKKFGKRILFVYLMKYTDLELFIDWNYIEMCFRVWDESVTTYLSFCSWMSTSISAIRLSVDFWASLSESTLDRQ